MAFDFTDFQTKAEKALDHITQELASLRTGKATVQLLDPVTVEAYGGKMKIHEVASVAAPDPNLLTVTPWDKSLLAAIERAISISGINLSPVVSGDMIRIVVPALTQERRLEMVKILHQKIEGGKVMIRNIRSDTKRDIDKQKGMPGVSEDSIQSEVISLDEQTKKYLEMLDQVATAKEKDLLTV